MGKRSKKLPERLSRADRALLKSVAEKLHNQILFPKKHKDAMEYLNKLKSIK
jgi:hypothetical protein